MLVDISERFISLSGEAPLTGYPMYFIRFCGCNITCSYCDTLYHKDVNIQLTAKDLEKDIREKVSAYPGLKVLLTGGEPLYTARKGVIYSIIKNNPAIDFYIETNGSVPVDSSLYNAYHILDWKSPSSLHPHSFCIKNLELMNKERDCLKLVISREDITWTIEKVQWINTHFPNINIFISPQWDLVKLEDIASMIIEHKLIAALSLQIHKIVWDKDKRGV